MAKSQKDPSTISLSSAHIHTLPNGFVNPSTPLASLHTTHRTKRPEPSSQPSHTKDAAQATASPTAAKITQHIEREGGAVKECPASPSSPKTTTTDLPTPPLSPICDSPPMTASIEANSRILCAKRNGNLKAVMAEFGAMKKQGLILTHHTYNLVLDAHASLRRDGTPLTHMLKIYDEMIRSHIQPSSYTYIVLLRTLCKRDVEVQKTVAMLKRQSMRTGRQTHDINVLEAEGNIAKALNVFRAAVDNHLVCEFDVEVFNQLLRVLSHYGNTSDARFVYNHLVCSPHTQPNAATYAALINLMGRAGDIQSALFFFDAYKQSRHQLGFHDASYVYNALVDAHLKCGDRQAALQVLKHDMIQDGVKVTIIPYNSLLRYLCSLGAMDDARQVLEELQTDPNLPQPDASSFGPVLCAYCQCDCFEEATDIYQALLQTDISKAYGNLANYILLCLRHGQGATALRVIQDMRETRLEPDAALAQRIIFHFAELDNIPEAIAALHAVITSMSIKSMTKGVEYLVNAALCITEMTEFGFVHTLQVIRIMSPLFPSELNPSLSRALVMAYWREKDTLSPSANDLVLLYESALVVCGKDLSVPSLGALVSALLDSTQGIPWLPSRNLFVRVLGRLQELNNIQVQQRWKAVWAEQEDASVPNQDKGCTGSSVRATNVNKTASLNVLKAVLRGKFEDACTLLKEQILDQGAIPDPEPIRDAIALIGKQGQMEIALRMYNSTIGAFKQLDPSQETASVVMVMNSILVGYAQQGDMVRAKTYYDAIKAMGHVPDSNAYASLLLGSAKCATDEATDALTIYDEAKRFQVRPTTFFYNVVISKLAKARKLEPALTLFEEMRAYKVAPNAITYGAIVSACVRAGSETHARRLFSEMLSSPSYQPRVGPFNNMMQFYIRQYPNREYVLEYFSQLRSRHIKPSAHTYKLLMEAYANLAPYDMPAAHRMLKEMERRDHIRPQATHYATLIYAYGTIHRDVESAQRVFDEMIKARIEPDETAYQAMVDALISNDKIDQAEVIYQEMLQAITKSSSPYIENLFIRGYGERGMIDKAEALFEAMTDKSPYLNGSGVSQAVREPSTYEVMVRAYLCNNMIDKAKAVLDRMAQREFPDKVIASVADLVLE